VQGLVRTVLEASAAAMAMVDRQGCICMANAEALKFFGWSHAALVGKRLQVLLSERCHEPLAAGLTAFFKRPEATLLGQAGNLSALRRDGVEVPMEMTLSPLTWGDELFSLITFKSVTTQRETQQAMEKRAQTQAAALMDLVGDPASVTGNFDEGVRRITEIAAATVGTARAGVWLLDDFGRTLVCADVYRSAERLHGEEHAMRRDFFPAYYAALQPEKSVAVESTRTDGRVADMVSAYYEPRDIGATLDAPVRMRGYVVGVICLEHVGGPRAWTLDEKLFASALADQAAQLLLHMEHAKAEQSAREATERLQEIFAHTTEAIFSLRVTSAKDFVYEEFNPAAVAMSGVAANKVCGRRPQDLLPPAVAMQFNDNFRRCLELGKAIEYVDTLDYGAGPGIYQTFLIPIRNEDGRIHRIAGFTRDVTEQKAAEQALRVSEEKFSKAFRSSPDAISVSDAETGRFIEINEGFERLFECRTSEVIGLTSMEMKMWAEPSDRDRLLLAMRERGAVRNFEAVARTRKGNLRPCMLAAETVNIGGRLCLVLVTRDITEQREAERALRESEARFRSYFESPLIGMAITSPDRRWLEVNDHLCRMLGYTREELLQIRWSDLTPEGDMGVNERFLRQSLEGELDTYSLEKRYRRKDGGLVHASIAVRCIRKPDGQADYFLTVVQDQTARIEAEQAQAELESQLRQAQKLEALGQLAGGIAHDFNNILTAIMAYTELAAMDIDNPQEVRSHLDQVQAASNRARDLVRRILTFSRQRKQERKPVHLKQVIEEALSLMHSTLPATIEVEARLSTDAPVVLADLSQVHQVLMNLCTNSGYAMRERPGHLVVSLERVEVDSALVRTHPELREGCYARLSVKDSGSGMPQEVMKRVFEPFFTTKPPGEGTGLGLSVVHGIMQDHEGAVMVESMPGQGTTFRLFFPEEIGEATVAPMGSSTLLRGQGERILFIDDEQALCDSTRQILDKLGYRANVQSSPVAGLEVFRAHPDDFDLVITDLTMPFMTGLEVAREMLTLRPELPILLASGFSGVWTSEKVRAEGLRDLLTKPLTASALSVAIRRVFDDLN
jgi:two-component system, cell cycle sensor histidine kinase and response regulator CckA